jgi:hypothetical protein
LQSKSEKCIFFCYSADVKGYRLLQLHCNEIIIIRDVKFDENTLAYEPNLVIVLSLACDPSLAFVPSSACDPYSMFVPYYIPMLVSSSYGVSEAANPPPVAHLPLEESFEPEPSLVIPLPIWVRSTRE